MTLMILIIALTCLSPVLTLLHLWQVKEWRLDRLREHLAREGTLRQLYGSLRPLLLLFWISAIAVSVVRHDPVFALLKLSIQFLLVLATLNVVQLIMRRQPLPKFTAKAILMTIVSFTLIIAVSALLLSRPSIPSIIGFVLIPFLCPVWVALSWIITKPIDSFLKTRLMRKAAERRSRYPQLTVVGVTGSVGKTTTKELLAHILKKHGALATPAHVNTEMGVATWLLHVLRDKPTDWNGTLIVEMGAYRTGEIALLCDIVKPHVGIITFIGAQHLSLFGSIEAIRSAKGELFRALPKDGHAFLNHDNAASEALRDFCACPVTTVGTDGKADLNALDIEETGNGLTFTLEGKKVMTPVAGTHTVTSILFAIGVARYLGMNLADIVRELATFKPLERSFQVKQIRGATVLDDTYNSSPDSFRAAIAWAKTQPQTEKTLLIDGIIELGSAESSVHAELARAASDVFARVIIGNPRFLPYFKENGFGDRAMLLSSKPKRIEKDSLLVCVGRVPRTAIDELLPIEECVST